MDDFGFSFAAYRNINNEETHENDWFDRLREYCAEITREIFEDAKVLAVSVESCFGICSAVFPSLFDAPFKVGGLGRKEMNLGIYVNIIGKTGIKKSKILERYTEAMFEKQIEADEQFKKLLNAFEAEEAHAQKNKGASLPTRPLQQTFVVKEFTPEGFTHDLHNNNERMLILIPEFSAIPKTARKKGSETLIDDLIHYYDGVGSGAKSTKTDKTRITLRSPTITLITTVQPELYEGILKKYDLANSGFQNRFLEIAEHGRVYDVEERSVTIKQQWKENLPREKKIGYLEKLLRKARYVKSLIPLGFANNTIMFNEEALDRLAVIAAEAEQQANGSISLRGEKKNPRYFDKVVKFSAILGIMKAFGEFLHYKDTEYLQQANGYLDIPEDITEFTSSNIPTKHIGVKEISIIEGFLKSCHQTLARNECLVSEEAKILIDLIDSGKFKLRNFTMREIKRAHAVLKFTNAKDPDKVLEEALEDAIEFGRLRKETKGTEGGGRPTFSYYVRPSIPCAPPRADITKIHS